MPITTYVYTHVYINIIYELYTRTRIGYTRRKIQWTPYGNNKVVYTADKEPNKPAGEDQRRSTTVPIEILWSLKNRACICVRIYGINMNSYHRYESKAKYKVSLKRGKVRVFLTEKTVTFETKISRKIRIYLIRKKDEPESIRVCIIKKKKTPREKKRLLL